MSPQGTIKSYLAEKGYGFIKPDDGGPDMFFHVTAVAQAGLASLKEGQQVAYAIEPVKKGKGAKAIDLHVLKGNIG